MDGEADDKASPFLFSSVVDQVLENALDYGLTEAQFWEMTIAELNRIVESKKRIQKQQAQERAYFDYALADLIGRSVARIHSSANQLPQIGEVYPGLFDMEAINERIQEKRDELSVLRFKQFAQSYNKKFKEVGKEE